MVLSLTPTEGDPDLYVRADGVQPTREPGSGYEAASMVDGVDVLELLPGQPGFAWLAPLPTTLQIGLFTWTHSAYQLVASIDLAGGCGPGVSTDECPPLPTPGSGSGSGSGGGSGGGSGTAATRLQPESPLSATIGAGGGEAGFDLTVADTTHAVTLTLTPGSGGTPELRASFAPRGSGWESCLPLPQGDAATAAPPAPPGSPPACKAYHADGSLGGVAAGPGGAIRFDPFGDSPTGTMLRQCRQVKLGNSNRVGNDGCTLHASVHCAAACDFTILGTATGTAAGVGHLEPIVRLVDGRPQAVVVPPAAALFSPEQSAYFSFSLPAAATGLTVSLHTSSGKPQLYATAEGGTAATHASRPTATEHTWATSHTDGLLLLGSSAPGYASGGGGDAAFCAGCTYHFGLAGGAAGAHASLTATAQVLGEGPRLTQPTRLADGVAALSSANAGECVPFVLRLSSGAAAAPIALSLKTISGGAPTLYMVRHPGGAQQRQPQATAQPKPHAPRPNPNTTPSPQAPKPQYSPGAPAHGPAPAASHGRGAWLGERRHGLLAGRNRRGPRSARGQRAARLRTGASPPQPPTAPHSPPQPPLTSAVHVQGHPGGSYRAAVCAGAGAPSRFEVTARLASDQPPALSAGGGGGGGVGGGVVTLLVLLGLGLLGGAYSGWRNPRAVGHARDKAMHKAASLLPSSLSRCALLATTPCHATLPHHAATPSLFAASPLLHKIADVLSRNRQPLAAGWPATATHPQHAAPPSPGTRSSRASVALRWRRPTRSPVCASTLGAAASCRRWRWPTASSRRPSRWRPCTRRSTARPCRSARLRPEATR